MTKSNPWNDVLGPFYLESGLHRHGIEETDGLIGLHTENGATIFPHAQFEKLPNEQLERREKVIELWNKLIRPAIDEGIVDEWTATVLLLQETKEKPSEADAIASDPAQVDRVARDIAEALAVWRSP